MCVLNALFSAESGVDRRVRTAMPAQIAQFGASDEARPEDDLLNIAAGTALGVGVCELRRAAQSLLNGLTPDLGQ